MSLAWLIVDFEQDRQGEIRWEGPSLLRAPEGGNLTCKSERLGRENIQKISTCVKQALKEQMNVSGSLPWL